MNKYIVSHPKILGGKPVVKGTRIPIDQILFLLKDGFTVDAINEQYPQLNKQTIERVIDEAAHVINSNAPQTV
ncbi:MAG: DUF433 domain-containing protein [Candidatus Levybacteria bacterium]|nr:DUF433 domain-containing protein [Candidatus Levybacteria bacterium]